MTFCHGTTLGSRSSRTVRTGTVFQAIWPFVIEAMRPISQCLAIHTADLRRFRAAYAVVCRRQGQKPAN